MHYHSDNWIIIEKANRAYYLQNMKATNDLVTEESRLVVRSASDLREIVEPKHTTLIKTFKLVYMRMPPINMRISVVRHVQRSSQRPSLQASTSSWTGRQNPITA